MEKNQKLIYIVVIILMIIASSIFILNAQSPKIVPYVNDFANVLSDEEETQLNILCDAIEVNSSWEIAIVTIPNTEGQSRVEYAGRIGDENGVGKKDKDNGLVILWSLDNEEGGAIATGRYSESIFNDAKVGRIGRDSRHYFDDEQYYEGFVFIIDEIKKEINIPSSQTNTIQLEQPLDFGFWFILLLVGIIFFGIVIFPWSSDFSSSGSSSSSSGSSSSSSSSSGGRGVSFGGGGFGGGGVGF